LNDALGHWAGDEILVTVAKRITAALRAGDTVARIGGDEFAVLMEGVDGDDVAHALADRIRDQLAIPVTLGSEEVSISASIGVATGGAGSTFESLLRAADAAMYSAKARGGRGNAAQ
jgi:diguanylate cyclase (GGDEF)-like protein